MVGLGNGYPAKLTDGMQLILGYLRASGVHAGESELT